MELENACCPNSNYLIEMKYLYKYGLVGSVCLSYSKRSSAEKWDLEFGSYTTNCHYQNLSKQRLATNSPQLLQM